MLTWVFIFLGAVDLTAVLILIGLAIATLEEICRREVTNKMRWIDPNPGKDERSIKQDREIKRSFMSSRNLEIKKQRNGLEENLTERRNNHDRK